MGMGTFCGLLLTGCMFYGEGKTTNPQEIPLSPEVLPAHQENNHSDYILGPSDVIFVSVWNEEKLSLQLKVRPDGKISLPLIADLKAEGLTPLELQDTIKDRLTEFISEPQVNVVVLEPNNFLVYLTGEVVKPGAYQLGGPTSAIQAIALAGGFTNFAERNGIKIFRNNGLGREVILVPMKDIIEHKLANLDPWLMPGDTIIVPEQTIDSLF